MDIGQFRPSELDAVVELWTLCGLVEPGQDPRDDIARNQASPSGALLLGRMAGVVAASVMVGFDGHRAWAYYVAVRPEHRSRGLGRRIMEAAEGWARERGAPKLMLMVSAANQDVLGFYAALGFEGRPVLPLGKPLD